VTYEFGPYRQDEATRILTRQEKPVAISPKAFDTLLYLASNSGRTVGREEIIQAVWPNTFVEEGNLNYNISQLRKILGEYAPGLPYIQTVPKHGYRFIAPVNRVSPSVPATNAASPRNQPRRGWQLVALASMAAAVILVVTLPGRRSSTRERMGDLVRLTSDSGLSMTPALSPDGNLLAYASDRSGDGHMDIWVQQVGGSEAIRLTRDPVDAYAPSFSPDGRDIVFRSEREGGGIYIISALGGEARKIAPFGRRPRFSPDGKWIAYWVGTDNVGTLESSFLTSGSAKMYIVPAAGGQPQQVRPDFSAAAYPLWAADSKHLLFQGTRDPNVLTEPSGYFPPGGGSIDWWVTPIQGGPVVATGANAVFRALGLASISQVPEAWTEDRAGVLMSATLSETKNLWRVPISAGNWKVSGSPRRVTFGTTMEMQASVAGNRVAFSSLNGNLDLWSLPIDADRAKPSGSPERLTQDASDHIYSAVSPDGTKIAYSSRRSGNREIWMRDLATGKDTMISARQGPPPVFTALQPVFSPDGGKVAYRIIEKQNSVAHVVSLADGSVERIGEDYCGSLGWSSGGKRLLCAEAAPTRISVLDLVSRRRTGLLQHAAWRLWNPRFSPGDGWVAFNATTEGRSRIFVVPFRSAGLIPESEWIAIAEGGWDDKARWSPDGNTLYFMSERDGFRCIWAQRLDASKRPSGQAIPIFHAHQARRSLLNVAVGALDMSVASDKIVFNMSERTGNIWMATVSDQE
jgi:Tol biopolymer transport system component/DNA-binding winged helix-turn-helix (wHTH) protein